MSEFKQLSEPLQKVMKQFVNIAGDFYEILSDDQTDKIRDEFVSSQEIAESIDRFASYMGKEYADKYFEKVFYNLKYRDTNPLPKLKNCTCTYRKKFNPNYFCYGMRCQHKKLPESL